MAHRLHRHRAKIAGQQAEAEHGQRLKDGEGPDRLMAADDHRSVDRSQNREADEGGVADLARAQLDHQPGVQDRGHGDAAGDHGEDGSEQAGSLEHVEEDLLRRVDEAEQRALNRRHRQGVAHGLTVAEHGLERQNYPLGLDRQAILGMQGLGQAQAGPDHQGDAGEGQHREDALPRRDQQDQLAQRRCENRHAEEDEEAQRHHLGHGPPLEAVAHDRHRQHPRRRRAEPLTDTGDDQRLERRRQHRHQTERDIDADTDHQDRLAPEPVRQRPIDDLSPTEAEQIRCHDPLPRVVRRHAERVAHGGQGRQHGVDRQRIQRHHQRDHADELGEARALLVGGRALWGDAVGGRRRRHRSQMHAGDRYRNRSRITKCCSATLTLSSHQACRQGDPLRRRTAVLTLAIAVLSVFGVILLWDLIGQPTKPRHFRRLLGRKSRHRR